MTNELTAFCTSCPDPKDVAGTLEELGFRLTFQMAAQCAVSAPLLTPLPAQFHYRDDAGTEVLYLAGKDAPSLGDDGELELDLCRSPEHTSRFWLSPGASPLAAGRALHTLAAGYHLSWGDHVERATEAA